MGQNSSLYVAFLRAVNVGGRMVAMADLRELAADLGFEEPRTLLQSGNLLFRARGASPGRLETLLEREAAKRFGFEIHYMVRTPNELAAAIAANPFPDAARTDPGHLVLLFLKAAPSAAAVDALRAAIKGRETVAAHGKHAFIVYPDGIGRSRLTNAVIERHLGRSTGRNWNTVLKLAAMARPT